MDVPWDAARDSFSLWEAQGQGKGETVQKGPTYTCEKLAVCPPAPRRGKALQCSLLGMEFFSS